MQEKQVRSLGCDRPLEEEMATHFSILAWRIPWTEGEVGCGPWSHEESATTEQLSACTHTHTHSHTHTHTHTHSHTHTLTHTHTHTHTHTKVLGSLGVALLTVSSVRI